MSGHSPQLQAAIQLHQNGKLDDARQIYQQLLTQEPAHAGLLNLLGLVSRQLGRYDEAVDYLLRAITVDSSQAAYYANLGEAYRGLGQLEAAIEQYSRAQQLAPQAFEASFYLGSLYQQAGRLNDALPNYQRAIGLNPSNAPAHFQIATVLHEQGKLHQAGVHYENTLRIVPGDARAWSGLGAVRKAEGRLELARDDFQRAAQLEPESATAQFNLANIHQGLGQSEQAIAGYREALRLDPNYAEALCNLGNALREQNQLEEALRYQQQAIATRPNFAAAHNNLGGVLQDLCRFAEAQASYQRAIELDGRLAEFHFNLGNVLRDQGQVAEALPSYDRALELQGDYPNVRCSRGMAHLSLGEFAAGWQGYEHRIECAQYNTRKFPQPRWDGERLTDRTLLLHGEQGFGDTLQFVRYALLAAKRAERLVVAVQEPLVPLLTASGIPGVISETSALPPFDVEAPLMSLPHIFGTRLENIPAEVPYLSAGAERTAFWRDKLANQAGFKVGIAWQGRREFRGDRFRSIPLAAFAPLSRVAGVRLFSLQKGPGTEQLAERADKFEVVDLGEGLDADGAFLDTAAIIQNLDLVITSDTVTAHLAGGLGARVRVALSLAPEWRWMRNREDSPWYPTMRLVRQSVLGQWDDVFARIAAELQSLAGQA